MKSLKFAVLPGDGIGPEVMDVALEVLKATGERYNFSLDYEEADIGGIAIDNQGTAFPDSTHQICQAADAILFGSVGGPKWESLPPKEQPERAALLPIRKAFSLYANVRPGLLYSELSEASPLKTNRIPNGIDIVCIRELTGGIYFGQPKSTYEENGETVAIDTMVYRESEIERIAHVAFNAAKGRSNKLTSIDKANVLRNGILWRETVDKISQQYPEVTLDHLYVDNAAMQLIRRPKEFDVVLAPNLFGDILSDEMAMIAGSLGMLASASLGESKGDGLYFGMYEPSGGSAPDIAGQGIANPCAQILSASLMLRYSLGLKEAADSIDNAVRKTIDDGFRTGDIFTDEPNTIQVNTSEMGNKIIENLS